jgi:polyhydroxyalkanoate synthesis repressor PhaR
MTGYKRYSNRKLYDIAGRRYVTLEEIAGRVRDGEDVRVVDHDTGRDLTAVTLAQALYERERRGRSPLPVAFYLDALRQDSRRRPPYSPKRRRM